MVTKKQPRIYTNKHEWLRDGGNLEHPVVKRFAHSAPSLPALRFNVVVAACFSLRKLRSRKGCGYQLYKMMQAIVVGKVWRWEYGELFP